MGCVHGVPTAVSDRKESPRDDHSIKESIPSRVSSSRRGKSFRLTAIFGNRGSDVEKMIGNDPRAYESSRFYDEHDEKKKKKREKLHEHACVVGYPGMGSIPMAMEAEQVAAGWPSWLAEVAGEAIKGWIPRRENSFEILTQIGQGTYSTVYKAREKTRNKLVALKRVRFDNLDPESVKFMAREILILRRLDHPNVIKLKGLITSKVSSNICLVFEYMEHDLTGLTASPSIKFTIPQVKCYMNQLLSGLEHCHSRNVLHRDIKGSNLLIDNNGILKIADFGLACTFNPDNSFSMTSLVVTLWYRPPELLLGALHYGFEVDLWSTGCILGELCSGKPIMPGRSEVEQLHKIFSLCGSPSDEFWKNQKLRHSTVYKPPKPYRRRVEEDFKDLPVPAIKLLDTLLSLEPELRGTAASALKSEFFTTKPLACHPSSLPKYPPSKEMDAKLMNEARRKEFAGGKDTKVIPKSKGYKESQQISARPANADRVTTLQKKHERTSNQPQSLQGKKVTSSGPLAEGAAAVKIEKKPDVPPRTSTEARLFSKNRDRMLARTTSRSSRKVEDVNVPILTIHGSKASNDNFSSPVFVPSNNVDRVLKDRGRKVQEVARRKQIERQRHEIEKSKLQGGKF